MHLSRVVIAFSCVFLQIIPEVSCARDLGNVDFIAIGVSLGITVFILAVVVYFLWRARNRSSMGTNNMNGHNNPAVTGDNEGEVRGISLSTL